MPVPDPNLTKCVTGCGSMTYRRSAWRRQLAPRVTGGLRVTTDSPMARKLLEVILAPALWQRAREPGTQGAFAVPRDEQDCGSLARLCAATCRAKGACSAMLGNCVIGDRGSSGGAARA
jgi:hypothetical protein